IGYRNSFQTFLFGGLVADGRKTRIIARSGMHPFAALFMAMWLVAVASFAAVSVAGVVGTESAVAQGVLTFVPLLMLVFGFALVGAGRWIARNERAALIAFLERTSEGKAVR